MESFHETRPDNKIRKLLAVWLSNTILKHLCQDGLRIFRKAEKFSCKIEKMQCHLKFDETCLQNDLLPNYTRYTRLVYDQLTSPQHVNLRAQVAAPAVNVLNSRRDHNFHSRWE